MMILQIANVGEWTKFLYTGTTMFGGDDVVSYDILFVQQNMYQYSMFQSRPTGFLRSSGILSGVLLFAMALHFARDKKRLWWGTIILCTMIVLSGARICYVGYILMGLLLLIRGNRVQRKRVINSILTMILVLMVYRFFVPALFERYWTYDSFFSSFFIRLTDISSQLDSNSTIRIFLDKFLLNTAPSIIRLSGEDVTSGYTILIKYLPFLIALFLIFSPLYIKGIRKQNQLFPSLTWVVILNFIVFTVYPSAVSIFNDQFYWMIGGFALSPLFIITWQHNSRKTIQSK